MMSGSIRRWQCVLVTLCLWTGTWAFQALPLPNTVAQTPWELCSKDAKHMWKDLEETVQYEGRLAVKRDFRSGFVSILGAPNMGKSTLLNALLKDDLCITTRRPQTTRHAILGLITTNDTQLGLIDTPGIIDQPAYKLQQGMMEAVMGAFHESDVLLVVTDLFSTPIPDDKIFQQVQQSTKPVLVVINKIDLVGKAKHNQTKQDDMIPKTFAVADAVATWRALLPNAMAIIPVVARNGKDNSGITLLRKLLLGGTDIPASIRALGRPLPGMFRQGVKFLTDEDVKALLPIGPQLYEDNLSDRTDRFFVSELIRETLLETLDKELPYCCEVRIEDYQDSDHNRPIIRIRATILVERESQKVIVIGKGGSQIKRIGTRSRKKVEKLLREKVYLDLTVKVNKDWRKKEDELRKFGYMTR